jgi:hypothetical protein
MTERGASHPLSRRDQALLVRLADGTLADPARARAEARAVGIPDVDRLIERQRRVARALGDGTTRPLSAPARAAPLRQRVAWLAPAAVIAATFLLLLVATPGGERSTVGRAAELAQLEPTQPPPVATGTVLRADVDGVRFPDWGRTFGWQELGMRRDRLDGRGTTTVYYEHTGHRLAYTIISGAPLPRPEGARVVRRDGLEIALYRDRGHGGHDVAVFERGGRTCVIAGHVRELDTLLKLAAWTGDGRIRS